ncbi:hypothetical protein IZ6_02770 [Terrihabitans soli]|uniref:Uncharacterized protein n=1 Tax=Terrihabitans soli TaxID=708113 RepID=A0A6S6QQI3_9HYPH|nr:hypothetical protein IZ6_02770 [Terrihabitans soli]
MFRLSAFCLSAILMTVAFMPGKAAAQYSNRSGGSFGGGGGYHSQEAPRQLQRPGYRPGLRPGGPQCYTKRTKGPNGQWQSETVCE